MLRIGLLASHEGTTLQSIIDACGQGSINGRVVVVISNNSGSGALRRAAAAGIDTFHISSVTHPSSDSLDAAICDALRRARADVIFLAGYMKRLGPRALAAFPSRILNTHPALLPKFGGQGMFGDRVFEVVQWAESKDFRGCPLQHTVSELTDAAHPARAIAHEQRAWFAERLREWTMAAGVKDSKATARALMVLFDGAVVGSEVDGPQRASDARWMARKLLAG